MPEIFLNIGSNVNPESNVRAGLDALLGAYGTLRLSRAYCSEAVGFEGEPFLNLGVQLDSAQPVAEMLQTLRDIEALQGRLRNVPRFSDRSLDIDLLLYGKLHGEVAGVRLPRGDIRRYSFVLLPLLDLAPEQVDPSDGSAYADLRGGGLTLEGDAKVIPFEWRGVDVSAQPAMEFAL